MYCPVCGAESTQGLNYCKRCGANLGTAPVQTPASNQSPRTLLVMSLVVSIIAVCVGGLGIALGIGGSLAANGVRAEEGPLAIVVCGSGVVLVVSLMLLRLLSRVLSMESRAIGSPQQVPQVTDLSKLVAQIQASASEVPSVTEHTTRTMDRALHSKRERS